LYRLSVFATNLQTVERHNAAFERGHTSYAMSLEGPFADLTDTEFETTYLMSKPNCSATHTSSGSVQSTFGPTREEEQPSVPSVLDLPDAVDWRTEGVITPIKSQKSCGSCWTFSTTGALEAHHCIAAQKAASESKQDKNEDNETSDIDCTKWKGLAEQQLVDCAGNFNNHGCEGGLPSQAFEYIHYTGGIVTEDMYKYTAKDDGYCKPLDTSAIGAQVSDVFNITSYNEDEIVAAVAHVGPVSIAYQVSPDFRFYSHGVYDSFNSTTNKTMCHKDPSHVNHAVVVVGYGDTMTDSGINSHGKEKLTANASNLNGDKLKSSSSIPFYIIRNSWGNTWGMEGYFWMIRGQNMCGISDCASFPIVPKSSLLSPSTSATHMGQKVQYEKNEYPKHLRSTTSNLSPKEERV